MNDLRMEDWYLFIAKHVEEMVTLNWQSGLVWWMVETKYKIDIKTWLFIEVKED